RIRGTKLEGQCGCMALAVSSAFRRRTIYLKQRIDLAKWRCCTSVGGLPREGWGHSPTRILSVFRKYYSLVRIRSGMLIFFVWSAGLKPSDYFIFFSTKGKRPFTRMDFAMRTI